MAQTIDKIVKSKYPPKDKNVMWVDTSSNPPVQKVWDGTWKPMEVNENVDYENNVINKPTINGVELVGNKTFANLTDGLLFGGEITTQMVVTPDTSCYYIATEAGTYEAFGVTVYNNDHVQILTHDGTAWLCTDLPWYSYTYMHGKVEDLMDMKDLIPSDADPDTNLLATENFVHDAKAFKGWFDSSSALSTAYPTPIVGDYAYVHDASPATTVSIYRCATAGTWVDSGTDADTSNVQTFASGEEVNETYIDDTQLINPNTNSIAKAVDVSSVKKNVDGVVDTVIGINLFDKSQIISDEIIQSNGTLGTVASWTNNKCTPLIPIEPNKYYRISGCDIGEGINIRCLASDGETKMKVLAPSSGTAYSSSYVMPNTDGTAGVGTMNAQFKTPPTAAFVQFNIGTKNKDSTNTTMIELVGNTYNPNFTPSSYEEYGKKYFIKKSALPKENIGIKVLLIGSSHGMNTISQVPWMLYYAGYKNSVVGNIYIGSFMIEELAQRIDRNVTMSYQEFNSEDDNPSWGKNEGDLLLSSILDKEWDVISLQRSASNDETWTTSQAMSFGYVLRYISAYCKSNSLKAPRIIFNTGFVDKNQSFEHTENIMSTAKEMKKEFGVEICPTAMALANARNTWLNTLGKTTYLCYDSQHLDYGIGCWVAGACFYEAVMKPLGESVATVNGYGTQAQQQVFISVATAENYTEPTEKTMEIAKACALAAFSDDENLDTVIQSKYQYPNRIDVFANWVTIEGLNQGSKCIQTNGTYSITFKVWDGRTLNSVQVTMGGVDITSTAYTPASGGNDATINIVSVTSDVQIVIKTVASN